MSPSEFGTTRDSRLTAALSTLRDRLASVHATGRTHLATIVERIRQIVDIDGSLASTEPAATDPLPPKPDRRPATGSDPTPDQSVDEDSGVRLPPDVPDESPFPVLADEPDRDINDVLLERGLTREEYVLEILEEHDGRLRQQRIKAYTGWSAASVSRLLGRMEEAERITRFRIGNEKVVCVPDADPRKALFESDIPVST